MPILADSCIDTLAQLYLNPHARPIVYNVISAIAISIMYIPNLNQYIFRILKLITENIVHFIFPNRSSFPNKA